MSDSTKTASEMNAAGDRLLEWSKATGAVLAIAATFGSDEESGGIASRPEALFAASMGGLTETEVAVLLAQLDVAVLILLSRIAPQTDLGEDEFRRIVNETRRRMLDDEGLDLCTECGG
jgi:surfactin synthase thioesterase subunit